MYDFIHMARDLIVIGNWKMYKTAREAADYIERLAPLIEGSSTKVFLAVPYTSIASAADAASHSSIIVGAQNMNDARDGAFTGEIAALMLKEAGAQFVILGHSERRKVFGETDEFIHRKVVRALQDDLLPVLCVGETLDEHKEGKTEEILKRQIDSAIQGISEKEIAKMILAYEPVWAIGTGRSATPETVEKAHAFCRKCLEEKFSKRLAGKIPILYGGSVSPDNVKDLVREKNIDGTLVGGASLDPETLAAIVHNCEGIQ
jgi:triosephosphate isomerase (TIM)